MWEFDMTFSVFLCHLACVIFVTGCVTITATIIGYRWGRSYANMVLCEYAKEHGFYVGLHENKDDCGNEGMEAICEIVNPTETVEEAAHAIQEQEAAGLDAHPQTQHRQEVGPQVRRESCWRP